MLRFGPAGNEERFSAMGYKNNLQIPAYLKEQGLTAFEYQCGRGVRITKESAMAFGEKAKEYGIAVSLHAPYYISLSGIEEEKRLGSIDYILQSARAVDAMGGDRIVIHSGSASKISRLEALELAKDTMKKALVALDQEGLSHIRPCPELMGKTNQLGSLEEVIALCQLDERMIPCIDFGHLNSRTFGSLMVEQGYEKVFGQLENGIGLERLRLLHIHFSKIEYTKGGEKKHLTFEDTQFGPDYQPLCRLLHRYQLEGVVICESAGTQGRDAATMKAYYEELNNNNKGE